MSAFWQGRIPLTVPCPAYPPVPQRPGRAGLLTLRSPWSDLAVKRKRNGKRPGRTGLLTFGGPRMECAVKPWIAGDRPAGPHNRLVERVREHCMQDEPLPFSKRVAIITDTVSLLSDCAGCSHDYTGRGRKGLFRWRPATLGTETAKGRGIKTQRPLCCLARPDGIESPTRSLGVRISMVLTDPRPILKRLLVSQPVVRKCPSVHRRITELRYWTFRTLTS